MSEYEEEIEKLIKILGDNELIKTLTIKIIRYTNYDITIRVDKVG